MDPWSVIKLVNGTAQAVGLSTGVIGRALSGPVGVAVTATMLVKKWVDSENSKVFEAVKRREGCPHITMLEGSPPTACTVMYVANNGGIAWRLGEASLFFWHPEKTYRPIVFSSAWFQGTRGVTSVKNASEFQRVISRPEFGYGCSECKKMQTLRA